MRRLGGKEGGQNMFCPARMSASVDKTKSSQPYLSIDNILVPAKVLNGNRIVLAFVALAPQLHVRPLLSFSCLYQFGPKFHIPIGIKPRCSSPYRFVDLLLPFRFCLDIRNLRERFVERTDVFDWP